LAPCCSWELRKPPEPAGVSPEDAAYRLVATFLDQLEHDLHAARALVDRHTTLLMGGTTGPIILIRTNPRDLARYRSAMIRNCQRTRLAVEPRQANQPADATIVAEELHCSSPDHPEGGNQKWRFVVQNGRIVTINVD
jgi:hypothetical protein